MFAAASGHCWLLRRACGTLAFPEASSNEPMWADATTCRAQLTSAVGAGLAGQRSVIPPKVGHAAAIVRGGALHGLPGARFDGANGRPAATERADVTRLLVTDEPACNASNSAHACDTCCCCYCCCCYCSSGSSIMSSGCMQRMGHGHQSASTNSPAVDPSHSAGSLARCRVRREALFR